MKSRVRLAYPVLAALAVGALLVEPVGAQYGAPSGFTHLGLPWENSRIRIQQVSVERGASLPARGDQVIVYLTADADGKLPLEAVWQPGGTAAVENRGPARLEAISIELKDVPRGAPGGTPIEALAGQYAGGQYGVSPYGLDVTPLIDNDRVLVTKHRLGPVTYIGPAHFHPEDVLVVYLRAGYTWPADGFWGASRVRRGDVDVIPANTFHQLGNAGSDPIEMLFIVLK